MCARLLDGGHGDARFFAVVGEVNGGLGAVVCEYRGRVVGCFDSFECVEEFAGVCEALRGVFVAGSHDDGFDGGAEHVGWEL